MIGVYARMRKRLNSVAEGMIDLMEPFVIYVDIAK
jgi:hypothetical protein